MQVVGLSPDGLPHQFGEIDFYVADGTFPEPERPASEGPSGKKDGNVSETTPQKQAFESLTAPMKGLVHAKIPVKASDSEAAKWLAQRKLRLTLDALNFFGDFFTNLESRVTLPGDASFAKLTILSQNSTHRNVSLEYTNFSLMFSFGAVTPTSARDSGFERVSLILANSSASPLDEAILSSLQWAGRASIETRREEAFMLFCIALEALLIRRQKLSELTQTFALRGAHLLVKDAARRSEAFEDLKHLYDVRSKIVHSGRNSVNQADLSKIRWLSKTALLTMLVEEPFSRMTQDKELDDWFQAQLLAGSVPVPPTETKRRPDELSD